ncbi:MAG TPA: NAD(P)H-quinone oxidoreductase [Propionibacteriaceae bacterium]|nr:NAD(P)H-quinone oxidoreductase [Propionibacteriaceae bacterium]
MRAIIATEPGGPEVLQIREVDAPDAGAGQILIKVVAAGVNRADLLQRQGHYPPPPGASPILGLEVSGQVAALGDGVTGWRVDDACVALLAGGGYAELVAVPAGQVLVPPAGLDLVTAGGVIEAAATVYTNLDRVGLRAGEVFLVHGGSGGIGAYAIQYAKAIGATVITTAGGQDKIDFCRSIGADHALSYREDWPTAVKDITNGRGVDVILDNMGARYLEDHVRLLATGGRLAVIGMQGGSKGILDLTALFARRASISASSLRARPITEKSDICRALAEHVWPLIKTGLIKPPPQTTYPLAEAASAHAHLESGDNIGKIILTVA